MPSIARLHVKTIGRLAVLLAVSVSVIASPVQRRPHDTVMKEIGSTVASLNDNLDSDSFSDAAQEAAALGDLFGEVEEFWAVFDTRDAIELARSAQTAAGELVAAAADGNGEDARRAASALRSTCGSCHDSHRESLPDGSFRIKP